MIQSWITKAKGGSWEVGWWLVWFSRTPVPVLHRTRAAELKSDTLYGHYHLKCPASTAPREY